MAARAVALNDRQVLLEALGRVDRAHLANQMVEAARESPADEQLSTGAVRERIRSLSVVYIDLFFRAISENREPADDEWEIARSAARADAHDGVPLEDILELYRKAGLRAWETVKGAMRSEEHGAALFGAERIMRFHERAATAVSRAYIEEREQLLSREEHRARRLFDAITRGGSMTSEILELAESQAFPITDRYHPFVQSLEGGLTPHLVLATALRSRGALAVADESRVVGLVGQTTDVAPLVRRGDSVYAFGETTDRRTLPARLDDIRLLVDLGHRAGRRGEIAGDEFILERLLCKSPEVSVALRRRVLGPLEDRTGKSGELLKTLETFVESGMERKTAAERLHVHPNTLDYRLRQIRELVELDLGDPEDFSLVVLALRQRGLASTFE